MLDLIERSFIVPAPVEVAWEHFAKVENWPSWARHIKSIERESNEPLNINSKGSILLQNGIKSTFAMTDFNHHENWKWVGPFLWLTVHYDHRFRPLDNHQCEMTFHVAAEGLAVAIMGRVFAMVYNRNLDVAIPNLVQELQDVANNR